MKGHFFKKGEGFGIDVLGARYVFKLRSKDTDGALCQFEGIVPPGAGSPPHRVHREDKTFFVLEGTFEFLIGEERITAGPGDFAYVPRGLTHRFTNKGAADGRLLVSFTPGGHHEELFAEVAALSFDLMDAEVLAAINAKYGVEVVEQNDASFVSGVLEEG